MDIEQLVGTRLGNYEIESPLGRGGMGVVYKARQVSLDRHIALKILSPILSSDPSFVKRFQREARAVARVNHPNIVQIHEIGEEGGMHFFSMEYVEGKTLGEILKEKKCLEVDEAVRIIFQVGRALEHAHRNEIIHRDIKPSNILMDSAGNMKVTDFGLARMASEITELTDAGMILGTVGYMSPEQCKGQEVDVRSDIYSLGTLLYEMLAGKKAFNADYEVALIHQVICEDPEDVRVLNSDVPVDLSVAISRAMAKDREDRYKSVSEFLEDLASCAITHPTRATDYAGKRVIKTRLIWPKHDRSRYIIITACFLIAASAVIAFSIFARPTLFRSEATESGIRANTGRTALILAAAKGDSEIVKTLLEKNADPDVQDDSGATALMVAIGRQDIDMAEMLLDSTTNVNAKNDAGHTALMMAVNKGYTGLAVSLLGKEANPNVKGRNNATALSYAARRGQTQVVQALLENGADPNIEDKWDRTPLVEAVEYRHTETARVLLENGADPDVRDEGGYTVLITAAERGRIEIVTHLLNYTADVDAKDKHGRTALMCAAGGGHADIVNILLDNGADPNAKLDSGTTVLMAALFAHFHAESLHGEELSAGPTTPATLVESEGQVSTVSALIDEGVDINARTDDGMTALMLAVNNGLRKTTELLLENGADIDAKGKTGETALMYAAKRGNAEMVLELLENGANPNEKDQNGKTALKYAMETQEVHEGAVGNTRIVQLLREAVAKE
jgi:ankyrin repeat protein/predicted Ser/Thr protein kinase